MKLLKYLEIIFSHSLLNILTPVLTFLKVILHPSNLRKNKKDEILFLRGKWKFVSPSSQGTLRDCIFEEINDISARRLLRYIFPPLNWKVCSHPCRLNKNSASKVIQKVDRYRSKKTHFEKQQQRLREEHYFFFFKKKGLKSKIVSDNFVRDKFEKKINEVNKNCKSNIRNNNVYLQFVTYRFINVIN